MSSSSVFLFFFAVLGLSNALPWAGPNPTASYTPEKWTPRPTNAPPIPSELLKRDSVPTNVCGWVEGDLAIPVVCGSGSSCIHDTIHAYVGCCTTAGPCTTGLYTSCLDMNSSGQRIANPNEVLTCGGSSVCNRNTYPGGYYQYSCGASSSTVSVATTYSGQATDQLLQVLFTGLTFTQETAVTFDPSTLLEVPTSTLSLSSAAASSCPTSESTSSASFSKSSESSSKSSTSTSENPSSSTTSYFTSSSFTASSSDTSNTASSSLASTTGASPSTTTSAAASNPTKKNKTDIRALTGGIIGGIAFLAILSALALWLRRRKQAKDAQRYRAGPFVSRHEPGRAPFHKVPFSPDDFVSPISLSDHGNPPHPAVFPAAYRTVSHTHRSTRTNGTSSPPREETPLFSEVEEFSRGWNEAILGGSDSSRQSEDNSYYGNRTEIVGGLRPAPSKRVSNTHLRGGHLRSSFAEMTSLDLSDEPENVQREGWSPAPLRTASHGLPVLNPIKAPPPPVRDPWRLKQQTQQPRYTLVDRPPTGEGVPVLQSPGGLRRQRQLRVVNKE